MLRTSQCYQTQFQIPKIASHHLDMSVFLDFRNDIFQSNWSVNRWKSIFPFLGIGRNRKKDSCGNEEGCSLQKNWRKLWGTLRTISGILSDTVALLTLSLERICRIVECLKITLAIVHSIWGYTVFRCKRSKCGLCKIIPYHVWTYSGFFLVNWHIAVVSDVTDEKHSTDLVLLRRIGNVTFHI